MARHTHRGEILRCVRTAQVAGYDVVDLRGTPAAQVAQVMVTFEDPANCRPP